MTGPKTETVLNSLIGERSVFEGKFYIAGSLKIDGKFEGEVKTEDELIVGESGRVKTDIFAKRVTIAGVVIGNIEAEEEVKLLATGKVLGNISAPKVYVEEGVMVKGEIRIHAGQKSDFEKLILDSYQKSPKIPDFGKQSNVPHQQQGAPQNK
ncbi:MAG: polymer-forming cytoskeletal protein [Spirochaetes bacterium]|nr:polymer-forming cytoskeletal protein [Spirochaetota bacterium]